jgi:hypothetical protein
MTFMVKGAKLHFELDTKKQKVSASLRLFTKLAGNETRHRGRAKPNTPIMQIIQYTRWFKYDRD